MVVPPFSPLKNGFPFKAWPIVKGELLISGTKMAMETWKITGFNRKIHLQISKLLFLHCHVVFLGW